MTMSYNMTQHSSINPPKWCLFDFIFYINSLKCPVKTKKDSPKVISESPLWVPELMFFGCFVWSKYLRKETFLQTSLLSLMSAGFLQSCTRETWTEFWPLWSLVKVMNLCFTFKCQIHFCTLVWNWPALPFHLKYQASPEQYTSSFSVFVRHVIWICFSVSISSLYYRVC